ncbi:PqqD family peptide modification chaperone [Nonomuraea rhodomycinica]|uniref:PqqD family peptide modification chaperone n=1 Tax=Nonomuraea rhodomycinica TaxID=1712872 RepID=A0A7Y6MBB1_9ACTN|nr:PqqD family peptide modification chaperone [Nonomuraea rhodomycinica]NUW41507.1 PqqD family peptide modification chaperone [Nonomuraea rhodomycinica]
MARHDGSLRRADDASLAWDLPVSLASGIEVCAEDENGVLLFDSDSGKYFQLGRSSRLLIPRLRESVSPHELSQDISDRFQVPLTRAEETVSRFLSELRGLGVLNVEPVRAERRGRLARALADIPMPRLVLLRDTSAPRAPRPRAPLRPLTRNALLTVLALVVTLSITMAALAVTHRTGTAPLGLAAALLPLILVAHLAIHELGHYLACRHYGVVVREVGVAFFFGILPRPYVDRSHAYRLPGRASLLAITMAGPVVDVVNSGIAGAIALTADDPGVRALAAAVANALLLALLHNLNPFMPSDGLHALEAATGHHAFRRRAITYLLTRDRRNVAGPWLRRLYVCYGVLALGYLGVLVLLVGRLFTAVGG